MQRAQILITPGEILGRIRRDWPLIGIFSILGLAGGLLYLVFTVPVYTATMTVAPPIDTMSRAADVSGAVLSSVGLGGLAGTNSPETFRRYEDLLVSQIVARRLDERHGILRIVYADRWDARTDRWITPTGLRAWVRGLLYGLLGRDMPSPAPNIDSTLDFLTDRLDIGTPAISSPIRTISLTYKDPQMAAHILSWVHEEADAVVLESMLGRTNSMINYLIKQLPTVTNPDERLALSRLLMDQEQQKMMLTVGRAYSSVVMDPPMAPTIPSHPRLGMTLVLGLFLGLGLGVLLSVAGAGTWLIQALRQRLGRGGLGRSGMSTTEL